VLTTSSTREAQGGERIAVKKVADAPHPIDLTPGTVIKEEAMESVASPNLQEGNDQPYLPSIKEVG